MYCMCLTFMNQNVEDIENVVIHFRMMSQNHTECYYLKTIVFISTAMHSKLSPGSIL